MISRSFRRRPVQIFILGIIGFSFALLANPEYQARAQQAWEIIYNGSVSTTKIVETDSGDMVPIYFPVPKEGETVAYGVQLISDPATKQLKVNRVKKKRQVRDPGDCVKCEGDEQCQECYPIGSGVNTVGESCYWCNGSGTCQPCAGSGDCYSCDGDGFETGCNTCGKVLELSAEKKLLLMTSVAKRTDARLATTANP